MNFKTILWVIEKLWDSGEYTIGFIMWFLMALVKDYLGWVNLWVQSFLEQVTWL